VKQNEEKQVMEHLYKPGELDKKTQQPGEKNGKSVKRGFLVGGPDGLGNEPRAGKKSPGCLQKWLQNKGNVGVGRFQCL